jgi:hypothetical protein
MRKLAALAATLAAVAGIAPAQAAGCNGVVEFFRWSCAPWDNNNGPQFPYYRKKQVNIQVPAGARVHTKDGAAVVEFNGQRYPVVGGANAVAAGGANVVAAGSANVVAAGGANLSVWVPN